MNRRWSAPAWVILSLVMIPPASAQDPAAVKPGPAVPVAVDDPRHEWRQSTLNINGVFPHMTVMAPGAGSTS